MDLRALAGDLKALKTLAGLSGRSKKRRAEEDTALRRSWRGHQVRAGQGAGVTPGGQQRDGPDRLLDEHMGPDAA